MRSGFSSKLNTTYNSCLRRVIVGKGSWGRNSVESFAAYGKLQAGQTSRCSKDTIVFSFCSTLHRRSMAASSSQAVSGDLYADNWISCRNVLDLAKPSGVLFGDKRPGCFPKASLSLKVTVPSNLFQTCGYFMSDVAWRTCYSRILLGPCLRNFHTFSSLHGAAPDIQFDIAPFDEQLVDSVDPSQRTNVGKRALTLVPGSCYLPHPDKEDTGGEDAHFICEEEQVIGIADGVGGWADVGVDAGKYARELMSNSVAAIKEESNGSIDLAKVLEKAHSITDVQGSSTACIITLTEQGIHAINLGDSGFLIFRDGSTIFRSPVQQYGFNFPYQLGRDAGCDLPSSGQVFTIKVAPGDVLVAGTDGLFDNLYNNEISAIVVHGMRTHLEPQVTAQKIAALARERAQDRHRQTPFSAAAQHAGIRYHGGKLDDITVVVSYVINASNQ
ncbi:hypothetical protein Ancab_026123 [Ancistrocladus abbreviatus]